MFEGKGKGTSIKKRGESSKQKAKSKQKASKKQARSKKARKTFISGNVYTYHWDIFKKLFTTDVEVT